MKTIIIGGGKGCRAIIELVSGPFLRELTLEICGIVDTDPNAPGVVLARERNLPTFSSWVEALQQPGIELIIELTGSDEVLNQIYKALPAGIRLIDHTVAHVFWDLTSAQDEQQKQLIEITELEKKVEKEWHFLEELFDTIPELVLVLDKDRKAMKINAGFGRFTGIAVDEAVGMGCKELLASTELSVYCREIEMIHRKVMDSGQPRTTVWETVTPKEAHWEVTHSPIADKKGKTIEVMITWHRITDKVMLHRQIESAEDRFQRFINSAHDWISIKDQDGRYIIVNPVCAQAFNRKPEDFTGKRVDQILPAEVANMIIKHDREVLSTNRHHTYNEVFTVDGRDCHYHTVRFPLADYKGSAIGVCTISRDITAERELRDQLVQSAKLAAVGKLAAGVAHEINNPLTGILAFAEDMREELTDKDPQAHDLDVIIRETIRCRDIVRNLLDFARLENLSLERTDPNRIVDLTLTLVEKLPEFRNTKIEIKGKKELPQIECDHKQLQQVILNLMVNAVDAMKGEGKIKLSTTYDRKQNKCIIAVEDNGPGIPENLLNKIFEPFFSTKGTNGLGLAVSWGIVEQHRGIMEVDMAKGGGAIFRVVLPVATDKKR